MKKNLLPIFFAVFSFLPLFAHAVGTTGENLTGLTLEQVIAAFGPIVLRTTQVLDSFALLGFFWGLAMYIWNIGKTSTDSHGTANPKIEGKQVMLWGIIALLVLTSITGIVYLLQTTFGLTGHTQITPPSADFRLYPHSTN